MAIDFPRSPTDGQEVSITGRTFRYSAVTGVWRVLTGTVSNDISELADSTGLLDGGGTTTYANFGDLPTTNLTAGDMAFVNSSKSWYITNGTTWFGIALTQDPPSAISNGIRTIATAAPLMT